MQSPEELTVQLEQVGGRLMQLAKTTHGIKIAEPIRECVQELRAVWSSLRQFSLVFDANRIGAMQDHERELRQAMEILNGTVATLSTAQERTSHTMEEQLHELDEIEAVDDASLLAGRLRDVTGSVREAALEMREEVQRSATELTQGEQIIQSVDRKLAEASRQILFDGLTRVLNHEAFRQRLAEQAGRPVSLSGSWSVLFLELDHIELVNKKFGRRVGDALLYRVAGVVQTTCESLPGAIVGRTGGRQFAAILPRASLREARRLAEELRAAVENTRWECKGSRGTSVVCTTVSLGVTEFRDGESAEGLVDRADRCCQQGRRSGGNNVVAEG